MSEVPKEALRAATEAVNTKRWRGADRPFAAHSGHQFDGGCAVCRGDVDAIVAVAVDAAAPLLAEQVRAEERASLAEAGMVVVPVGDVGAVLNEVLGGEELVIVSAEDLRTYLDRGKELPAEVAALNRLRAALSEIDDKDGDRRG